MSGGGGGGTVNPTRCIEKPWDLWVSEIGRSSPRPDEPAERKDAPRRRRRTGASLLRSSSMSLHGLFPQTDNLNAVVCHMCGAVVKCSGAYRHLAMYHSAGAEPALPPPPAPTVKLKSHGRSKHKKEPVPPPPPLVPESTPDILSRVMLPTTEVYCTDDALKTVPMPVVTGDVQVCVDGELPVVSIQDPEELPLGENITDDIFAIMNSEGIQSADDPESTAAWKNIIRDISTLQDAFPPPDVTEYTTGVDPTGLPTYTLSEDLTSGHYTQSSLPTVLEAVALNPTPAATKSRPKSSKSKYNFREYDPNKHCGVITVETQKPCTRSLTCKAHTLSLRRTVEGRAKPFDTLLAEHKAAREASAAMALGVTALPPAPPAPAPVALPLPQALLVNTSIDLSSFNSIATDQQVTDIYTSLLNPDDNGVLPDTSSITSLLSQALPTDQFLLSEDHELGDDVPILSIASPVEVPPASVVIPQVAVKEETVVSEGLPAMVPGDVSWYPSGPRPLAMCTFNASHAGSAIVLGKKFATVRSNIKSSLCRSQGKVQSATNNYYNFSQSSMTSLSKNVHLNNTTKCSKPEVRRLIVSCPQTQVKSEQSYEEVGFGGVRHNGHVGTSKRTAVDAEECEVKRPHHTALRNSVKVAKHVGHMQNDMLELSFMFDPLMADEKC